MRELDGARAQSAGMMAVYERDKSQVAILAAVADACRGAALKQASNSSDSAHQVNRASGLS